jgi:hypothetical protein
MRLFVHCWVNSSEIRNSKSETNPNIECQNPKTSHSSLVLWILMFDFVSDFGLGISEFDFEGGAGELPVS